MQRFSEDCCYYLEQILLGKNTTLIQSEEDKNSLVVNHIGELLAFKITQGNRHDNTAVQTLLGSLHGLVFGKKGYIGKKIIRIAY